MSFTVSLVERRDHETPSIERVIRSLANSLSERGINVRYDKVRYGNSASGILANVFGPKLKDADIYHVTGHIHYYALLLPPEKTILTIHDLHILTLRTGIRRHLIKKFFFDWPVRRLSYITVVSEQTKRELIDITNCPEAKIQIIENPLTVEITPHTREFNTTKPVILQIGTSLNKNLTGLIAGIKGLDCTLRIIGRLDKATVKELRENDVEFENRFDLSESEIRDEYMKADIVSFCSTSEGFGLPIIEAQAMMVPIITSGISPMKEVSGNAAILVDPSNPAEIRSAIRNLIENENLRSDLVGKGLENVKRFSVEGIAEQYEALYRQVLDWK